MISWKRLLTREVVRIDTAPALFLTPIAPCRTITPS